MFCVFKQYDSDEILIGVSQSKEVAVALAREAAGSGGSRQHWTVEEWEENQLNPFPTRKVFRTGHVAAERDAAEAAAALALQPFGRGVPV